MTNVAPGFGDIANQWRVRTNSTIAAETVDGAPAMRITSAAAGTVADAHNNTGAGLFDASSTKTYTGSVSATLSAPTARDFVWAIEWLALGTGTNGSGGAVLGVTPEARNPLSPGVGESTPLPAYTPPANTAKGRIIYRIASPAAAGEYVIVSSSVVDDGVAAAAPAVSAGADATGHTVNTAFTRTATETGASITARSWSVVSGPAQVGTTLGTAAALNWTPGTVGTYVLRYSATNAGGTGTDDMSLAVVAASATSAGADQSVSAGTSVTLTGSPSGGSWMQLSGATVTLNAAGSGVVQFTASNSTSGALVRVFRYTANGTTDDVQVTTAAAPAGASGPTIRRREAGVWVRRKLLRREAGAWIWG